MTIERTAPVNAVTSTSPRVLSDMVTAQGKPGMPLNVEKSPPHSASVTLSAAQARLLRPTADDSDPARVEAVKDAIRKGELVMNPGKIADALIRQAQELLRGRE